MDKCLTFIIIGNYDLGPREIYVQVQYTVMLISWKVCPGEDPLDLCDHNYIVLFCHVQRANKEQQKKFEFLLLVT